jgi:hypothetical protein
MDPGTPCSRKEAPAGRPLARARATAGLFTPSRSNDNWREWGPTTLRAVGAIHLIETLRVLPRGPAQIGWQESPSSSDQSRTARRNPSRSSARKRSHHCAAMRTRRSTRLDLEALRDAQRRQDALAAQRVLTDSAGAGRRGREARAKSGRGRARGRRTRRRLSAGVPRAGGARRLFADHEPRRQLDPRAPLQLAATREVGEECGRPCGPWSAMGVLDRRERRRRHAVSDSPSKPTTLRSRGTASRQSRAPARRRAPGASLVAKTADGGRRRRSSSTVALAGERGAEVAGDG